MKARSARYHNISGPEGTQEGDGEKAPAAMSRKVAMAEDDGEIVICGDLKQRLPFSFTDECLVGAIRPNRWGWTGPLDSGSNEMVTVDQLADMAMQIGGKELVKNQFPASGQRLIPDC